MTTSLNKGPENSILHLVHNNVLCTKLKATVPY